LLARDDEVTHRCDASRDVCVANRNVIRKGKDHGVVVRETACPGLDSRLNCLRQIDIEGSATMDFARDHADQLHDDGIDKTFARGDLSRITATRTRCRYPITLVALDEKTAGIEHRRVERIRSIRRDAKWPINCQADSAEFPFTRAS